MTLTGLLNLIPPDIRDHVNILRVKSHDQMNRKNQFVYAKKRYLAFLSDDSHLYSCLQGRHLSLPCHHFFATILIYWQYEFHINLIDNQWVVSSQCTCTITRNWIHLSQLQRSSGQSTMRILYSNHPPIFTTSPEMQIIQPSRTSKCKIFDPFQATKPLQTILETPTPSYKSVTVNRQLKTSTTQRLDTIWRLVQDNSL